MRASLPPFGKAALLMCLAVAAYAPALSAGFIWDDDLHLLDHVAIQPNGLYRVWFEPGYGMFWPVTFSTYWLEHRCFGLDARIFHATNLVFHAVNAVLVWHVLLRWRVPAAFLAAAIFAVHPLNVETAAWVAQRKGLVCMLFMLTSMLLWQRFLDRGGRGWQVGSAVAFLASMLSKGASVTLPAVLLLQTLRNRGRLGWRDAANLVPHGLVAIGMAASEWRHHVGDVVGDDPVRPEGLAAVASNFGWVVGFYFWKTLWPFNLSFVYPRWPLEPGRPLFHLANILLVAACLVMLRFRRTWGGPVLIGVAAYLLLLFPACGFVKFYFLAYSWVGDHYQYLAMPAALTLIVSAATQVGAAITKGTGRKGQLALSALAAAVVVLLMLLSQQRTMLYRDVERLWLDTLAKSPGAWMARHNLALHYSFLGRHADALDQFERLLARPEYPRHWPKEDSKILTNYANALNSSGRESDAEKAFRKAIDLDPEYPKPRNNLATMLANTGQFDAAIREYEALLTLPLKPKERARYLLNLGTTHADRQEWPAAEAVFRASLAIDGTNAAGCEWLGIVAARQDRQSEAKQWLGRAIDLETTPATRARILMNLASIHESEGDLPAAAKRASEASRLEPTNPRFAATAEGLARRLREEPSKPQRSITPEAQPR